ncbi:hypothetical protein [Flavobacterium sp.]|uniref:hypothetical protein n=1 Tax=Flavobacterium sp. TaxID=239 RepID=UPI003753101D
MKTILYILFGILSMLLFSCQKEEVVIVQDTTQNLTNSSPLTDLISRVSQNPTSNDNIIDSTSCFSVRLPVTVIVNSNNIVVASTIDYQTVQDAIDEFSTDDDIVNFVYPITIEYQNFTTQILNDSNDLDDALDQCDEDDGFDEIDCINLNYPIVINVYDSNNQLANTLTLNNNSQLYNFLENLNSNQYIAINYPISMINSSGNTVVITNNQQFEDSIDDSIDDCNDTPSSGGNPVFSEIIINGSWHVSYYFDDEDETSDYNGYNFTFLSNGTVTAIKTSTTINGNWSNYLDSGENKLNLNFDGSLLDSFEDDWRITEFTPTLIKLKDVSGGNGGTDYLYFTKN